MINIANNNTQKFSPIVNRYDGSYVWAFVDSLKKGGWVNSNYIK